MLARQRTGSEMDALKDIGLLVGLWDEKSGIRKGRPFRVHSDTHANQVLRMAKEMFIDYKKTRNNEQGKLIELIKEYEYDRRTKVTKEV